MKMLLQYYHQIAVIHNKFHFQLIYHALLHHGTLVVASGNAQLLQMLELATHLMLQKELMFA
jgi:hypothetical protein